MFLFYQSYYENGATAKLQDFYNPDILDQFVDSSLNQLAEIKKFNQSRDLELWLGETSSCFGGGSPTLSNSYVAGFMYVRLTCKTSKEKNACPQMLFSKYKVHLCMFSTTQQ